MQAARGASLNPEDESGPAADETPRSTPPRRLWLFAGVLVTLYAADLATKVWAVSSLQGRDPVTVLPGLLDLRFLRNPGAAFGMATGYTLVLSVVAVGIVVVVSVMATRLRDRTWALALGLLLAGALGNLTDRVFREPGVMRGHVVDFLQLTFVDFPIFNVADMCITTAAALIVLQSLRGVAVDGSRENDPETADDRSTGSGSA